MMEEKIIGCITSVYDTFYIDQLNVAKRAKEQCDYLIIEVSMDELVLHDKEKVPVIPYEKRVAIVVVLKYVDKVVPQPNKNKLGVWEKYHFDKTFVESDWKGIPQWQCNEEKFVPVDVEIIYLLHIEGIASTELASVIKGVLDGYPHKINAGYLSRISYINYTNFHEGRLAA